MSLTVLFAAGDHRWKIWEKPLRAAIAKAGLDAHLTRDAAADRVDAMIYAPGGETPDDFTPFTNCKAVFSLWAGVERIVGNQSLSQPLCRMVDPGLTAGMVEYVTAHVLRYHTRVDDLIEAQDGRWEPVIPPLASERKVAILGLGALGAACGKALAGLGFDVLGWSRSAKSIERVRCFHGADGLRETLSQAEIVVTLLPSTPATENTLDAESLAWLPKGACIINPGRGPLIDDDALLAALDSCQVARATLDVFRIEPLPTDHPYWAHPRVTVTPHIAAETRPETAAHVIAENLRRVANGDALLHQVDRTAGY